jgi:hypothetical protein
VLGHRRRRLHLGWRLLRRCRGLRWSLHYAGESRAYLHEPKKRS